MTAFPALALQTAPTATGILAPHTKAAGDPKAKAHATAVDYESVFLNTMFSQMFTGLDAKGEFGKDSSTGVWRSFQIDQYAKSFAKAGGIGIADQVYPTLLAQQEGRRN